MVKSHELEEFQIVHFAVVKSFIIDISLPLLATDENNVRGREWGVSPAGSALQGACFPPCAALEVQDNSEQRKENRKMARDDRVCCVQAFGGSTAVILSRYQHVYVRAG